MSDTKWKRLFIRNPASGEPWYYCGLLAHGDSVNQAVAEYVLGEIDAAEPQDGETVVLEFKRQDMTDAEVDALPDM